MNITDIIDKIDRKEPLTQEEIDFVTPLLFSEDGKQQFVDEMDKRWDSFDTAQAFDYDKFWKKVYQQIQPSLPARRRFPTYLRYVLETAAVLILAFGLYFFLDKEVRPILNNHKVQEEMVEIYNPKGLRTVITLPDSSRVTLNADSKVSYAYRFAGDTRAVALEGEAFFEVEKDSLRPFIVQAGAAKMTVLGTSFNVRSYPEDKYIETTLLEGSLRVDDGNDERLLEPGRQISIDKTSQTSDVYQVNTEQAVGWKEGKLYFQSNTFEEIARTLERVYNVKIMVQRKALLQKRFTGKFENGENLELVLRIMKHSSYFTEYYEETSNTLLIY